MTPRLMKGGRTTEAKSFRGSKMIQATVAKLVNSAIGGDGAKRVLRGASYF
jgi:hypothetical protein